MQLLYRTPRGDGATAGRATHAGPPVRPPPAPRVPGPDSGRHRPERRRAEDRSDRLSITVHSGRPPPACFARRSHATAYSSRVRRSRSCLGRVAARTLGSVLRDCWTSAARLTPSMPCPPVYRRSRRASVQRSSVDAASPSCPPRRLNALTICPRRPHPRPAPRADAHRDATARKDLPIVSLPGVRRAPPSPLPTRSSTCTFDLANALRGRPAAARDPQRPCGTTISSRARGRRRHRQRSRTGGTRARRRRTR